MLIRTQDKASLINMNNLTVIEPGKNPNVLFCRTTYGGMFKLGSYATAADAKRVIDWIFMAYTMRERHFDMPLPNDECFHKER